MTPFEKTLQVRAASEHDWHVKRAAMINAVTFRPDQYRVMYATNSYLSVLAKGRVVLLVRPQFHPEWNVNHG